MIMTKNPNNINDGRNGLRNLNRLTYSLLLALCSMLIFSGCASLQQKEKVLAVVDGEPITEADLEYSLNIAHRREDLSSAGSLMISDYIHKLVDDRLIIDEARRSGMDQYPEIKRAMDAYILREAVLRLHDDEIVKKVSVTDQEIRNYYEENYDRFALRLIEVMSMGKAEEIMDKLKQGEDFEEIARNYSVHMSRNKGGKVVYERKAIPTYFIEAISHLQPGEISGIVNVLNKYYILKLMGREDAPGGEEFEKLRGGIERTIRTQKEHDRSSEYLQYLRQKASIKIHEELFSSINFEGSREEIEQWSHDSSPLVEIGDKILTVGEFIKMARPSTRRTKEDILNSWIDLKLVDIEALSRHYEREPELKRKIYRYENQLLKDIFIKRVVVPQIAINDEVVKDYYLKNKERFVSPARYKVQIIAVKEKEDAQMILKNLQEGADFSWWARMESVDSSSATGGDAGWFTRDSLPQPLQMIIDTLRPGDITPILEVDTYYMIARLNEKVEEKVREFSKVKDVVRRALFNDQRNTVLEDYIARLKADAEIKFYDRQIRLLEEKLQR